MIRIELHHLLWLLLAALLAGCGSVLDRDTAPCTLEFRQYTVTLLNSADEPVEDAQIHIRNAHTGELIDPCSGEWASECEFDGYEGRYTLLHDGLDELIDRGDILKATVHGTSGEEIFSGNYQFTYDGCHIRKLSGPDTLRFYSSR